MKKSRLYKRIMLSLSGFIIIIIVFSLILFFQRPDTGDKSGDKSGDNIKETETISPTQSIQTDQNETDSAMEDESSLDESTENSVLEGIESVKVEDLTEVKLTTPVTFDGVGFPLVAEIPEEDIYLYGTDNGVVLKQGDEIQKFEWNYLTPRFILPWIELEDFDGDGIDELLCVLYVGSGTGVSISELHMLEPDGKQLYRDIVFCSEDYISQLHSNIECSHDKENKELRFMIEDVEYIFDTPEVFEEYTFDSVGYGSIISYEYTDNLVLSAALELNFAGIGPPRFLGSVTADVEYKDESFLLTNFSIMMDQP